MYRIFLFPNCYAIGNLAIIQLSKSITTQLLNYSSIQQDTNYIGFPRIEYNNINIYSYDLTPRTQSNSHVIRYLFCFTINFKLAKFKISKICICEMHVQSLSKYYFKHKHFIFCYNYSIGKN